MPPSNAGDLGPGLEGLGLAGSILVSWKVIAAGMEEVVDPVRGAILSIRKNCTLRPTI